MSKTLIVGNWKMNPSTLDDAKRIIKKTRRVAGNLKNTEVVACPPFVFIPVAISKRDPNTLKIGAQTVSSEDGGAHTGEVSVTMLRDIGVKYVIAGHSEEVGMNAILCIGEKVRDEGGAYLDTLKEQIKNSLANIPQNKARNIVLAYEPVWAIGAKEAMKPEQVYEMSLFVKKVFSDVFSQDQAMKVSVLYGGAVNFRNAAEIVRTGQVDGLLIGRESVNLPGFIELLKEVDGI